MATGTKNPATVTIYGRLSYPVWTHAEAVVRNSKSKFVQTDHSKIAPEFNLVVEDGQLEKFNKHVTDVFFPWCLERNKAGEKSSINNLDAKQIKVLTDELLKEDHDMPGFYIPVKSIPEKTVELAPECSAMIKVVGNKGQDIELEAIVNDESELKIPDPDIMKYPIRRPIGQTVHDMYAGCYVVATLNLYSYTDPKPGFSASASVAIFKADGEPFGGGVKVDDEEIFLD